MDLGFCGVERVSKEDESLAIDLVRSHEDKTYPRDLPEHGLRRGDLGAVVEVYAPEGIEVEFVRASGRTQALVELTLADVREPTTSRTRVASSSIDVSRGLPRLTGSQPCGLAMSRRKTSMRSDT